MPEDFTCEGDEVSPPLEWSGVPAASESLALVMEDPDAEEGTFVHWIVFNLPPDRDELPEDLDVADHFEESSTVPAEGVNDFGDLGYGAPCPPEGDRPHRYVFRLYALDTVLDMEAGASRDELKAAMKGHVLAEGKLTWKFGIAG